MNSKEFIEVIKYVVRDAALEDTITNLEDPPGRKIPEKIRRISEWYKSLPSDDKELLRSTILDAIDSALFGFLCVIDGVRSVEDGPLKGYFELRYIGENSELLNSPNDIMLHDLYNAS